MRFLARTLALSAALLLVTAASAGAEAFTPIGSGEKPVIAVDPSGVGHAAWVLSDSRVRYCRIPAGGTSCASVNDLPNGLGLGDADTLNIFAPAPNKVRLLAGGFECSTPGGSLYSVARYDSNDGGATFSNPACKVLSGGNGPTSGGLNWLDAKDRFYATAGVRFLALPPGSTPTSSSAITLFGAGVVLDSTVAGWGSELIVANRVYTSPSLIRYAVFRGGNIDSATTESLNDPTKWDGDLLAPDGSQALQDPVALAGPAGVFLAYRVDRGSTEGLFVSRLDPASHRLLAPVLAASAEGYGDFAAMEDTSGRIHLTWHDSGGRLNYTTSGNGGQTFSAPVTLTSGDTYTAHRSAAGPDGRGWSIWETGGTIRLVRLDAASASGNGSEGGPGDGAPAPGAPRPTTRSVKAQSKHVRVTLRIPSSCVARGARFKARLTWARRGSGTVTVRRVAFRLQGRRARVDRRAPFAQTLSVPAKARRGARLRIAVTTYAVVRRAHRHATSTTTVRSRIRVCGA